MKNYVYFYEKKGIKYPNIKPYSPSIKYPEYLFDKISKSDNYIYDSVRNLFHEMKLDLGNYGTKKWNPLKNIIKPGDNVVIKPNMVLHSDSKNENALTTHGSIIRAVLDYVFIALNGKGNITIADAPVQSCIFEKVAEQNGIIDIVNFYNQYKNFNINLIDFRQEQISKIDKVYIKLEKKLSGDPLGYTVIDLNDKSAFYNLSKREYRVTNYNPKDMKMHHDLEKHQYLIPNTILNADVIINLPKPKTHRKAGITAALKNIIGISGNKAWLPHHSAGSKEEKGDEYLQKNIFRNISSKLIIKRDVASKAGKYKLAKLYNFLKEINERTFVKIFKRDIYSEGSWWGNDTIWRTIHDLNKILMYSDSHGIIKNKRQRNVFSIADMIVSGEKEGPLLPTPKRNDILVAATNSLAMDASIATIMGFDYKKIPYIANGFKEPALHCKSIEEIELISNNKKYNKKISEFKYSDTLKFEPSKGWKDHIELK